MIIVDSGSDAQSLQAYRRIRPGETQYLMSGIEQFGDDSRADKAGSAGDENTHDNFFLKLCVQVGC